MTDNASDGKSSCVILVTGLSGAGKTTVLKALEDNGVDVIDNLPVALLPSVFLQKPSDVSLAVGIDTRARDFDAEKIDSLFKDVERFSKLNKKIVFLDCSDEKLLKRFTETRRAHPLAKKKSVPEGIAQERVLLEKLRADADVLIDTTRMSAAELRRYVEKNLLNLRIKRMVVSVCSFSFRQGVPAQADLVFDVRFLRNPHYDLLLRPLTGQNPRVAAYIAADRDFYPFFEKLTDLLTLLLPRYAEEGKSYLTIAVGCTGGKHRSVYTAEMLYAWLLEKKMYTVVLEHLALPAQDIIK